MEGFAVKTVCVLLLCCIPLLVSCSSLPRGLQDNTSTDGKVAEDLSGLQGQQADSAGAVAHVAEEAGQLSGEIKDATDKSRELGDAIKSGEGTDSELDGLISEILSQPLAD